MVQQNIPDFSEWGWQKVDTNTWKPLWTTLNDASVACAIIMHCGCLDDANTIVLVSDVLVSLCKCEEGCINNDE